MIVLNHNKGGSSPALAWAPQVRVRKRIAQVHRNPGPTRSPPAARPAGRRARGRKAPCTPLGALHRRLRTRKVPIPLLLCSLRFVLFSATKHHFGASKFTDNSLTFLSFQLCSLSAGEKHHSLWFSHPTAISWVLKQLRVSFDKCEELA